MTELVYYVDHTRNLGDASKVANELSTYLLTIQGQFDTQRTAWLKHIEELRDEANHEHNLTSALELQVQRLQEQRQDLSKRIKELEAAVKARDAENVRIDTDNNVIIEALVTRRAELEKIEQGLNTENNRLLTENADLREQATLAKAWADNRDNYAGELLHEVDELKEWNRNHETQASFLESQIDQLEHKLTNTNAALKLEREWRQNAESKLAYEQNQASSFMHQRNELHHRVVELLKLIAIGNETIEALVIKDTGIGAANCP